jgi:hypothetical protein
MEVSDQRHVMRRFIKICLLVQTLLKETGKEVKPLSVRLASTAPIGWRKFIKESPRKSINHAFMWLRKDHSGQDVGSVSCRSDAYEKQTSQIRGFNISLFKFHSWPHARLLGLTTLFIHILISKIEPNSSKPYSFSSNIYFIKTVCLMAIYQLTILVL